MPGCGVIAHAHASQQINLTGAMLHGAGQVVVAEATLAVTRADVSRELVHGARPAGNSTAGIARR